MRGPVAVGGLAVVRPQGLVDAHDHRRPVYLGNRLPTYNTRDVNKVKRTAFLAARVDPELAEAVRRLAHLGNRSTSREVAEAVRRHVILETPVGEGTSLAGSPVERRTPEAGAVDGATAPGPTK